MRRTCVLDTNVLLHDPGAIFSFQDQDIVIPIAVIEEIDNQKKRNDEVGGNARQVSRCLDNLRANGKLAEGISLENGSNIRVELNHQALDRLPYGLGREKYDNRILAVASSLNEEIQGQVTLVTKDLNLRIKADALGLAVEDYDNDKVDFSELYTGVTTISVISEIIDYFYKENELELDEENEYKLLPNQFVILKDSYNPSKSVLARYLAGENRLVPLYPREKESEIWGVCYKNKEQRFALDLLLNDDIKLVTLVGSAGTGKTLLTLAAGLQKVIEDKHYQRLLVTRPIVPMGNDIGYLPGDKEEKLRPWMQPIFDNLEFLCHSESHSQDFIRELKERKLLEIEALTYIRGRSIPNQYIICDEAQNLTPHMVKTIITRVGLGSKIIFTGDPYQIDNPYLDPSSNGLTYLVEKFKDKEIAGHITLTKGERSPLAELGAKLL